MARIKLDIPANKLTSVSVPVRISDINYGNHLGNDSLVSIIHEVRVQWLKENNYSEIDIGGAGIIMSDLAVEYLGEGFYGDVLNVTLSAGDISRVSFELYFTVEATRNGQNVLIARAKTGMVCYDYQVKKVAAIPMAFRSLLGS